MKAAMFLVGLALAGCSCFKVATGVRTITAKHMYPGRNGICIASHIGSITTYIPMQGGVCAGVIEIIPPHYSLSFSDGTTTGVNQQDYDAAKVGDTFTTYETECK